MRASTLEELERCDSSEAGPAPGGVCEHVGGIDAENANAQRDCGATLEGLEDRYETLASCLLDADSVDELDACEGPGWRSEPPLLGELDGPAKAVMSEALCRQVMDLLKAELRARDIAIPSEQVKEIQSRCVNQADVTVNVADYRREVEHAAKMQELSEVIRDALKEETYGIERCYRASLVEHDPLEHLTQEDSTSWGLPVDLINGAAGTIEDPTLQRVAVDFVVDAEGKVSSASTNTEKTETDDPSLGACVARAVTYRSFEACEGGPDLSATVTYSLSWK